MKNLKFLQNKRLPLIFLIIFIVFISFFYIKILIQTPLEANDDIIQYIKYIESINADGKISLTDLYSYTPLLFFLASTLSLITSANIGIIVIVLTLIQNILLILLLYQLGIKLFHNHWTALITAIIITTHADQLFYNDYVFSPFIMLRTSQFSFLLFIAASWLAFSYLESKKNHLLPAIYLLIIASLFFHHQSGIMHWLIFFTFFSICLLLKKQKKTLIAHLLIGCSPLMLGLIFKYILNKGVFKIIKTYLIKPVEGGYTQTFDLLQIDYFYILGGAILVGSILGLCYLIKERKQFPYALIFILTFLGFILFGIYQNILGLNFFPRRFLAGIHFPAELLVGFFCLFLIQSRKKIVLSIFIIFVIGVGLINYGTRMHNIEFNMNWNYLKIISWAKDNIEQDDKFISDVLTIHQFENIAGLTPALNIPRIKDVTAYNKTAQIVNTFVESNNEITTQYLNNNKIEYIIINTKISPLYSPGNYNKFFDNSYYEIVHQQKITDDEDIIIYRVQ